MALTRGAYVTLSDLRAGQGQALVRVHRLRTRRGALLRPGHRPRKRVTESAYGSFAPAPGPQDLYVATCGPRGYAVAVQPRDALQVPVEPSPLPRNRVNPPRRRWDVVNLDTVRFSRRLGRPAPCASRAALSEGAHAGEVPQLDAGLVRPLRAGRGAQRAVNIGATLVSQNLLSNAEGFVSYGAGTAATARWCVRRCATSVWACSCAPRAPMAAGARSTPWSRSIPRRAR